jgi:hypothetical protein
LKKKPLNLIFTWTQIEESGRQTRSDDGGTGQGRDELLALKHEAKYFAAQAPHRRSGRRGESAAASKRDVHGPGEFRTLMRPSSFSSNWFTRRTVTICFGAWTAMVS